jgi:hypothetical protein
VNNGGTVVHAKTVVQDNRVGAKVEQHNHIHLNVWGRETADHITPELTREIVKAAMEMVGGADANLEAQGRAVLSAMARAIWQAVPANHVAYLPNVKGDRARVRTENGWEERSSREVEEAMHGKTVYVTGQKQPMETARDIAMMDPVLREINSAPVPRAAMRAMLVNMRPGNETEALRAAPAGLAAQAKAQGPQPGLAEN